VADREVDVSRRVPSQQEMKQEADHLTGGPGVVATKSQARGSLAGIAAGVVAGVVIGFLIGLLIGGTMGIIITVIVGAVAGATLGGVAGGIVGPSRRLGPTEVDK
jgi:F0F1-type ATP synthase assembly protein I